MKILYLIRGIPGSGKTSLAKNLTEFYFEADQYFMKDGVYNFDVSKLKDAHAYCKQAVELAMSLGIKTIAVSNPFTRLWEMNDYKDLAKEYDYDVVEIIMNNNFGNDHGVPEEKVKLMKARFEYGK